MPRTTPPKPRSKQRPTYHHGDLRAALIDASIAILRDGSEALTLRNAARHVGVSHAAPKNHFGDLAGLLEAVAVAGFRLLLDALSRAAEREADAVTKLLAVGEAYVRFALGSPGHFRAMFHPSLRPRIAGSDLDRASQSTFGVLLDAMTYARSASVLRDGDVLEFSLTAWSVVHGLARLALDGHLARKGFDHEPAHLARTVSMHLYAGLRRA